MDRGFVPVDHHAEHDCKHFENGIAPPAEHGYRPGQEPDPRGAFPLGKITDEQPLVRINRRFGRGFFKQIVAEVRD